MAYTLVHTFTSTIGTVYSIYYDPDTASIDTQYVGTGEVAVTEAELGVPEDHVFYVHCFNTFDLYTLRAQVTFPFAYLQIDPNSPTCGYSPPTGCDIVITSVTVTNETTAGAGNGTATINTTISAGFLPLEYSMDGITWQASQVFSSLFAGIYTAYVRSQGVISCAAVLDFVVASGAGAFPVIPWTERFCHFFRLETVDTAGPVDVSEPAKWDAVIFKGLRDRDWHGYNSQYSDGNLQLEFDCAAGRDIIEAEYLQRGSDGVVYFYYGYTYQATDYILFNGKLNLNTRKWYPAKTTCSVERKDFNQLLQSRFDTKVSMSDTKSVDGVTIPAPPVVSFTMHAKQVERHFRNEYPGRLDYPQQSLIVSGDWFIQPETESPQLSEIEDFFGYPLGVSNVNPTTNDKFSWRIKFNGTYTFNTDHAFELKLRSKIIANDFTLQHFFKITGSVNVTNQIGPTVSDHLPANVIKTYNTHPVGSGTFILEPGDRVFIYSLLHFTGGSLTDIWLGQTSINWTGTSLETAPASDCKGWFIFEAIDHALANVTNGGAKLVSTFLARQGPQQPADGPASLFITTNGKQIRQYDPIDHPLRISSKELLASVRAIFAVGMGLESSGPLNLVRVERINYFYRNREILVIEESTGYYEETAKDLLANETELGYEKFLEEGFDTLDEFNTVRIWTGPIQTNKLKFVQKSSLISSGYAIEDVRRQQFADTATDSYQFDEEGFIISMVKTGPSTYVPERDENFLTVNNLISPSTAYNLRISPLRMLLNWAIWLKNVFFYKQPTDAMKNTWTVQNGKMETQFLPTEPNPIGDIALSLWTDRQDMDLVNYAVEEQIFKPDWIFFKCRLTPDKIQLLDDSLRGARTTATNYGFITVKDPNGLYQAGWVYDLNYNFASEAAEFKLLKKWDSPVTPGDACCEYLVVNGCYVLVNGNRIIL